MWEDISTNCSKVVLYLIANMPSPKRWNQKTNQTVKTLNLHQPDIKEGRVLSRSLKKGITPAMMNANTQSPAMTAIHTAHPTNEWLYRCFEFHMIRKNKKRPTTEAYNTPNITIVGIANEYAIFLNTGSSAPYAEPVVRYIHRWDDLLCIDLTWSTWLRQRWWRRTFQRRWRRWELLEILLDRAFPRWRREEWFGHYC